MPTFFDRFKSEISRLAKKEIRAETQTLKRAVSQHRSEIASLKRRLASIEQQLKKAGKGHGLHERSVGTQDSEAGELRFRADGFASLRKKFGLSAAEMGRLLGVSAQSVYHWETGKTKPRASQLLGISAVRKMGKKEVVAKLSAEPSGDQ